MGGGLCASILAAWVAASAPKVGVVPLWSAVDPDAPVSSASENARLRAARGERETFFAVVHSGAGRRISAKVSPLVGTQMALSQIPATLGIGVFVPSRGKQVVDPVIPLPKEGVWTEHANIPLVVEIRVPRSAHPGAYRGKLEISVDSNRLEVPIRLEVMEAVLPPTSSLSSIFELPLAQGSKAHLRQLRAGLDSRITLALGKLNAPAFRTAPGEGLLNLDTTAFDRDIGPLLNGVPELEGAQVTALSVSLPQGLSRMNRFKYLLAFRRHLRHRGWADRMVLANEELAFPLGRFQARTLPECRAVIECRTQPDPDGRPWWHLGQNRLGNEPSLAIGADPTQVRAIGWTAFDAKVAGLRYAEKPGQAPLWYEADGAESVRLKLLRDGLEDYELLHLAARSGRERVAHRWAKAWIETKDGQTLDRARAALGQLSPLDASFRAR